MAFSPVVPVGGLAGLRFIDRTYGAQFGAFSRSPDIRREIDYFLEKAGGAATAADLVADRRLLKVALGAFGLEDEVDKRAFVRKVLEDGTLDRKALANRLADPAWAEFSRTLGYGDLGGLLIVRGVREDIAARYRERQFERALGDVDLNMRLALSFRRRIREVAADPNADQSGWFRIMGSEPLRRVFETAYGLPSGFGKVDIDRQRADLGARTERLFGSPSPTVFASPENVERLLRRFLAASQAWIWPGAGAPGMAALTLLRTGGLGTDARASLFASRL